MEEEIKSQEAEERHQKLLNEFRKLGEEYAALQVCIKGFSSRIWQITSMKNLAIGLKYEGTGDTFHLRLARWRVERADLFSKDDLRLPSKKLNR